MRRRLASRPGAIEVAATGSRINPLVDVGSGLEAESMSSCTLRLTGASARGAVVSAQLLRELMGPLVDGVQESVRLRAEGRSRAAGAAPAWLEKAASFDLHIQKGSTQLVLSAPSLGEAAPEKFSQRELFRPLPPEQSCLDVFAEALDDALGGVDDSDRYDDALVATLEKLGRVFRHGIDVIELENGRSRRLVPDSIESLHNLRRRIPPPQRVRLAGKLDVLRHSNRTFGLVLDSGEAIAGVLTGSLPFDSIKPLLGHEITASGQVSFRPSGRVLRVEADQLVPAEGDQSVWGKAPKPLLHEVDTRALRQPQGPRSGLAAIIGQWPGDEDDETFDAAIRDLS